MRPLSAAAQQVEATATLWTDRTAPYVVDVAVPSLHGVFVEQNDSSRAYFRVLGHNMTVLASSAPIPLAHGTGGAGFTAVQGDQIAFPFQTGAGDTNQDTWTLYLWTASTGKLDAIAHNPSGPGGPLSGGYVHPFFSGSYLYWIQASVLPGNTTTGSELMQYDLQTGATRVIFNGLVTAAVGYHDLVLFAATAKPMPGGGGMSPQIKAAIQTTGQLTTPPAGLDLGEDNPLQMVSNGDIVVWDSNAGGLRAWRPETGRTFTLVPRDANSPADLINAANPNDLAITGPIMAWDSHGDYLMDLRTNTVSQLGTTSGTVGAGDTYLGYWLQTPGTAYAHGAFTYSAYLTDLATFPRLTSC